MGWKRKKHKKTLYVKHQLRLPFDMYTYIFVCISFTKWNSPCHCQLRCLFNKFPIKYDSVVIEIPRRAERCWVGSLQLLYWYACVFRSLQFPFPGPCGFVAPCSSGEIEKAPLLYLMHILVWYLQSIWYVTGTWYVPRRRVQYTPSMQCPWTPESSIFLFALYFNTPEY